MLFQPEAPMSNRTGIHRPRAGLVVLITLGLLVPAANANDSLPDDLASKVTIRRDNWGVPHILAETEEAVYFGQGYACAEDHCLIMAREYLKARGQEAAHFGEQFAASDFLAKRVRVWEVSKQSFPLQPPWVQRMLDAYALGYSRYVAKHRADLPQWVKPATGVDVLALGRRGIILGFSVDPVIRRRFLQSAPQMADARDADSASTILAAHDQRDSDQRDSSFTIGSNMWAINKDRSASGKAILMGNPHLPWDEFVVHESHLTVPGSLNLMGATGVGAPGITLGFNEHLGWSLTVNAHDSDDLYELELTEDGAGYLYEGRPIPLEREDLIIQVKMDGGLVTRTMEAFRSHYGPTLKLPGGKALAWKSANFDECRAAEQLSLMSKARSLAEFRSSLDMGAMPMFNICYADQEGNCFYLFNGRFPDRPAGYNWAGIVPGGKAATEWNRMLPQARLPSLLNPPGGYVQNCNSSPWYTSLKAPIDRRQFPSDLTPNFNTLRQQLSLLLLNGDEKLSLQEIMKRKFTTKLLLADRVKGDLLKLARGQTVDGVDLDEAVRLLEAWDDTVSRESAGGLLFIEFWKAYGAAAGATRPADAAKLFSVPWDETRPAETPAGIANPSAARTALAAAIKALRSKYGRIDVAWGDVHRLRRGPLDEPIGGCDAQSALAEYGVFRVIWHDEAKDGKRVAAGGDSYVFAVEFTSPPTAHSILAYSQSSDPKSPHHADQSALFAREAFKRAWFTEADIAQNLKASYRP
jgi:acyl-homoserine-lactone acylase